MGGGFYSYSSASTRSNYLRSSNVSREEIFHNRKMSKDMDIKGKVRESCDGVDHPKSFPIIIALDVTGSMGVVPENLIKEGFPEIMKKIMDEGVQDPQVCFVGIGDHYTDDAPIQVGQFESSDELTEKWLKDIWLEGGGGGNGFEGYSLAYYFAARHTKIDSFAKRNKKGVLITIGDDACNGSISKSVCKDLFGEGEAEITTSAILEEAKKQWDVYHINLMDYLGQHEYVRSNWSNLLGDHVINTEDEAGKDIPNIISGIVLRSYNSTNADEKLDSNVED